MLLLTDKLNLKRYILYESYYLLQKYTLPLLIFLCLLFIISISIVIIIIIIIITTVTVITISIVIVFAKYVWRTY